MAETTQTTYDKEKIRERIKFPDLLRREFGVELRRVGKGLECRCPFHEERTPSFHIKDGEDGDFGHCFGCGWSGDIFKAYMASRGCTFPESMEQLAGLCGVYPSVEPIEWKNRTPKPIRDGDKKRKKVKPILAPLKRLKVEDVAALAELRGLSEAGVKIAAHTFRRVAVCEWPQWQSKRTGQWSTAKDAERSWVITDESRWCAQYRRLDGEAFLLKRKEQRAREIKAWTKGSPSWPIGAAEMGERASVLLVEGGADLLAAYHFLWGFGMLGKVAVVAMLGSSNRIMDEALPFFRGKRVRIMMDADQPKGEGEVKRIPSMEAAARWQRQLTTAGAAVESFSLYGLETASGAPVKDLNDLALCSSEVVGSEEITDAFYEWDF